MVKNNSAMKKNNWIYKYFTEEDLSKIQSALERLEKNTQGEVVISFHRKRSFTERLYDFHELAMKDFRRLNVHKTKLRTGILLFIIFEDKYYDIIADEGIYRKISDEVWNEIEENLCRHFREGKYAEGVLFVIESMYGVLRKQFPALNTDDEIGNEIVIN
jgi:uncharacterized membrane protein